MSRPRLQPRPFRRRCPYCRDDLTVGADAARCAACGTDMHPACRAEHQACPVCGVGDRPIAAQVEPPSTALLLSTFAVFLASFFGPLVPLVDWLESLRLDERPALEGLGHYGLFLLGMAGCIVGSLAITMLWVALLQRPWRRPKKQKA